MFLAVDKKHLLNIFTISCRFFSGTVRFLSDFQFQITRGPIVCSNSEYVRETVSLESTSFP
jgi:hypothetical protein